MNVLQICHKMPFPPNDGGTLAMYQLSKAMLDMGWKVKVLGIGTAKHPITEMPLDEVYKKTKPEGVTIDTTPKVSGLLKAIYSDNNYIVNRFDNNEFRGIIKQTISENNFDLVILEGTFTAIYIDLIKQKFKGLLVMRSHNVEFQLWEDRMQNEESAIKRLLLKSPIKQLREFELTELKKVDVVAAISMSDKAFFNSYFGLNKTIYVPFGISLPDPIAEYLEQENKIVFLGALDWDPNIQGIKWFLEHVWPLLKQRNTKIEFHIAGRNAPENFGENLPESVIFHGEVSDAHSFISSGVVFVVPLLSGSGIRIKIIEGLALGQVVSTTTKGAQGIKAQNERDILIGDTPKQMVRQILESMKQPSIRKSISLHARKLAEKEFDISNTQKALLEMVKTFKK